MSIKSLVGKRMSKRIKFMCEDVEIFKLSVSEVMAIQEQAKNTDKSDDEGFNILKTVVRAAVAGGNDLTDEEFTAFPMDELSKLSNEIMKFSGLGADQGK